MDKEKYLNDLKEIRDIMDRSSRFISLSGFSGISAGIFGLAGAYIAYLTGFKDLQPLDYAEMVLPRNSLSYLLIIALATLLLAISIGIYFTRRETKKRNLKVWDHQTKRLLINLAIPLLTGGIVCLMLLFKGFLGIVVPLTLIFYGLALVNASKYTLSEIRSLGLLEILLGLIAMQIIDYSLPLWAAGFGILHIVYGIIIPVRYTS